MKYLLGLVLLLVVSFTSISQTNGKDEYQVVLDKNEVGKAFSFSNDGPPHDSLVLVYLGKIRTKKGQVLKIMTSCWYWGLSQRATSRVIVFNAENQNLGNYQLTMNYEIPDRIEGTSVVFINNRASDCTPGLVTKVDFLNGIPDQFFLRCKESLGDFYRFDPIAH